jgi:putative tryptophan/tyrosine transport system substrate-binding protein
MKRRALLALLAAGSVLGVRFARASSPSGSRRLGIFAAEYSCEPLKTEEAAVFKALADLGHVEGRNLTVEWRCFGMDFARGAQMAAELVRLKMDVLWTAGTPQTKALHDVTTTIPIVTSVADPVAAGFTESLGRPRGNITGLSQTHPDTPAKQIELIRRVVPKLDRIMFIDDVRYSGAQQLMVPREMAARAAGLAAEIKIVDRSELERIFIDMKRVGTAVALLYFVDMDRAEIAKLSIRHGVPTMLYGSGYVERGGLMTFNMYHENEGQRFASIVDKLLRGIKPADIPWELPDRSHLAINLGTAKLLGLKIPTDLLLRADQVVE